MWSIGCVLSEAATWVVLGKLGVLQFRDIRYDAMKRVLKKSTSALSISGECMDSADFFHNGTHVLPEVTQWHELLGKLIRPTDHITQQVLGLVDQFLLRGDPKDRFGAKKMHASLKEAIKKAESYLTDEPFKVSVLLEKAIDDAIQREADELQMFIDSQSTEQRQAAKTKSTYLQLPGSVAATNANRPSIDPDTGTLLTRTISGRTGERLSFSGTERLGLSSTSQPFRPVNTKNSAESGNTKSDIKHPPRQTIFDTYYLSQQKSFQILGINLRANQSRDEILCKHIHDRDLV